MAKEPATSINYRELLPDPLADPYGFLGFIRNPDGSVTRQFEFPTTPAASSGDSDIVLTKDVTINPVTKIWARIFLPRQALDSSPDKITKLPLIVDFHAGGFVALSAASEVFNNFYSTMAMEIPAVIVSVEYRRAPEHRLPAAYDDGFEALHWIKNTDQEWLIKYADLSSCFLQGSSAGGNIAYNVGLRASSCADDLQPLLIKGLILLQPFFGGIERTQSELRLINNKALPPCVTDVCWELSLPIGANRDHEYCDPKSGLKTHLADQIKRLGWKILVKGCDGDQLIDHQIEFVKLLEKNGVQVVCSFDGGGFHGIEFISEKKLKAFCHLIRQVFFMKLGNFSVHPVTFNKL